MAGRYNGKDFAVVYERSDEVDDELGGDNVEIRYDTLERRFRLFHLLRASDCTRQDIFEQMGEYYRIDESNEAVVGLSSQRAGKMLLRDLRFLERVGYTIERFQRNGYYSLLKGSGPFPHFRFGSRELEALALLHTLFADPTTYVPAHVTLPFPVQPPRNPFAEDILVVIERLVATLSEKQKQVFDTWIRKPYVYLNLDIVTDYLPHRSTIDKIVQAIAGRQQISFEYAPMHRQLDTTPHKRVDPYYITRQDGHLYLVGYSQNPYGSSLNKFFEYRIDRIKAESITILPEMIDGARQRRPIEFRFWLDASLAKSGLSQRWLTQAVEKEEVIVENGKRRHRLLVCAQAYSDFRIMQQLLKYGSKVELIDPPELRDKMRKEVERLHTLYQK